MLMPKQANAIVRFTRLNVELFVTESDVRNVGITDGESSVGYQEKDAKTQGEAAFFLVHFDKVTLTDEENRHRATISAHVMVIYDEDILEPHLQAYAIDARKRAESLMNALLDSQQSAFGLSVPTLQ